MSHFTVLVFGDDVDAELAPFHEFESTGYDDEYVQIIDVTDKYQQEYNDSSDTRITLPDGSEVLEYTRLEDGRAAGAVYPDAPRRVVHQKDEMSFEAWLEEDQVYLLEKHPRPGDAAGPSKYRYRMTEDGKTKVYRRTNPNRKWDWYRVGGRWDGFLLTLDGEKVNSCTVAELDFEGMVQRVLEANLDVFDRVSQAWTQIAPDGTKKSLPIPRFETFLKEVEHEAAEKPDLDVREESRKRYYADPVIAAITQLERENEVFHLEDHATFWGGGDREAFAQKVRNGACPYAFLLDGEWVSRGTMHMFGVSTDEDGGYYDRFVAALKATKEKSPDMEITIVDCHI